MIRPPALPFAMCKVRVTQVSRKPTEALLALSRPSEGEGAIGVEGAAADGVGISGERY